MKSVNVLYKVRKEEIFGYYKSYKKIDVDNIDDVNDKIIDVHLKKENFENPLEEFYIITAMCIFMIDNDLYDEYFFSSFDEILEEYNNGDFDDYFLDYNTDKKELENDINKINEYVSHDNDMMNYYDNLSEIYTNELNEDK